MDGGIAAGVGRDVVGEVGSSGAQVVFDDGENAFLFVIRVSHDEQAGADGGDDANRAAAAMEGIGGRAFGEVAHEEDGTLGMAGQAVKPDEHVSHLLIIGHADFGIEHGNERINDDQDAPGNAGRC